MDMQAIEVTDFKSEVRSVLQGCFEVIAASEAAKKSPYQKSPSPIAAAGLLGPYLVY